NDSHRAGLVGARGLARDRPRSGPSSRIERRHLLAHGRWPEVQLRLIAVVRPASKLEILNRRLSAHGKRHDMVELDESPLRAPPVRADERASAFIAGPHRAPD